MKEYELYLFDFDNTLYDTVQGINDLLSQVLPSVGLEYDPSKISLYLSTTLDNLFHQEGMDDDKRERLAKALRMIKASDNYRGAKPFPEAAEVLGELKARGKRMAIVSGKAVHKIENLLADDGLGHLPEFVIGWEDTERHKPYPDPILLAMSRFDIPPERCVYVGDSSSDPIAAEAAGIDSVVVRRAGGLTPEGLPCTYELPDLRGLLDY